MMDMFFPQLDPESDSSGDAFDDRHDGSDPDDKASVSARRGGGKTARLALDDDVESGPGAVGDGGFVAEQAVIATPDVPVTPLVSPSFFGEAALDEATLDAYYAPLASNAPVFDESRYVAPPRLSFDDGSGRIDVGEATVDTDCDGIVDTAVVADHGHVRTYTDVDGDRAVDLYNEIDGARYDTYTRNSHGSFDRVDGGDLA